MNKDGEIRLIALGLIRDGDGLRPAGSNRLFLSEGYDPVKKETFYRFLGGGVEFGETSRIALEREFQEEIQADLTNIRYLACIENLFTFDGRQGHEIIQLYQCDFADRKFYELESLTFSEPGGRKHRALWVDIARCQSGEFKLVPEIVFDYL